ncbi:hypothetical protein Moror_15025 [Moniliophthora roreri MCA 2997]|uniref:Heme haloperoxidase family profile domain-containing protein n=1 Tax=Moniliophthora roreri (strain MCA 2997) TaxID=1381753 RepID=V2W8J8_MONRO|nr:hypothetical protein Moror_15025 [Moniliophthora roreri MCA 2997]
MTYSQFYTPRSQEAAELPPDHPVVSSLYPGKFCPCALKETHNEETHKYRAPQEEDIRSVCPALNTMANHGYIPRNGRNLTFKVIFCGLKACYGLSTSLATILTLGGFLAINHSPVGLPFGLNRIISMKNPDGSTSVPGIIDLKLVGRHGRVEHDASLVHEDCPKDFLYPPVQIRKDWVYKLVGDVLPKVKGYGEDQDVIHTSSTPRASSSSAASVEPDHDSSSWRTYASESYLYDLVSCADVGRMRARREREISPKKLHWFHRDIARGEMAIILGVWERETYVENLDGEMNGGVAKRKKGAPLPFLLTWLADERLPDGWKPDHVQSLKGVSKRKRLIRKAAKEAIEL